MRQRHAEAINKIIMAPRWKLPKFLQEERKTGSLERAMRRFRRMQTLQKFAAVHASAPNHFNLERHRYSRANFKLNRAAALVEGRLPCSA